jgi:hypothetical protein
MARPREIAAIARPIRLQLKVDIQLSEDIDRIAKAWKVRPATASYWLLRGLMADARGSSFVMAGDLISERLGYWLAAKFPQPGEDE